MTEKKLTIREYLKDQKVANLSTILNNYSISSISIELFFKVFAGVEQTPEAVVAFITDTNNSYELSLFGHRASGKDKFYGYNGKSTYQGTTSTLGASHSKFHG